MKKLLHRLMPIFMAVMMVVFTASQSYAQDNTLKESEITDYDKYLSEVQILESLGIYSCGGKDEYNEQITAKEFLEQVCKLIDSPFDLEKMKDMNFIPFYSGRYKETASIQYIDIIKTMVIAAGYEPYVTAKGESRYSYMNAASAAGISDGIQASENAIATKALFAKVLYNTLLSSPLTVKAINGGNKQYTNNNGETMLSDRYNIYIAEGLVNASEKSGFADFKQTGKDRVIVGTTCIYSPSSDIADYMAYNVKAFYRKNNNENTLLYYSLENNKDFTLIADDIIEYENGIYHYDENGKTKKIKLTDNFKIFYNEKYVSADNVSRLPMKPTDGRVKLLDNNGDGRYDIIFIENLNTYRVKSVNISNNIVITKENESIDLERFSAYEIYNGSVEYKVEALEENDVIALKRSLDNSEVTVLVSKSSKSGIITTLKHGKKAEVELADGSKYIIPDRLKNRFFEEVSTNYTIKLYFGVYGQIYDFDITDKSDMKLAYLVDVSVREGGIEPCAEFLMFDIASEQETVLKSTGNITIDGALYGYKFVNAALQPDGKIFQDRLIRYKLNSDGMLSEIDTAFDNGDSLHEAAEDGLIKLFASPYKDEELGVRQGYYFQKSGIFHKVYLDSKKTKPSSYSEAFIVDAETKILFVPSNRKSFINYTMMSMADLPEGPRVIDAYRVGNDTPFPSLVVYYNGDGSPDRISSLTNNIQKINEGEPFSLVKDISLAVDDDGNITYKLTLVSTSGEKEIYLFDIGLLELTDVKKGNLIAYSTNPKGYIDGIKIILDDDKLKGESFFNETNSLKENRYIFADVYEKFGNNIIGFTLKNPKTDIISGSDIRVLKMTAVKAYVYDYKEDTVEAASYSSINDYITYNGYCANSKVMIQTHTGGVKAIFIFNNTDCIE